MNQPGTGPAGPQQPFRLGIGMTVWFHSRTLTGGRYEQPRCAWIAGPGAQPTLVNLTVLSDPLTDVQHGREAPLMLRRNIPIFQAYPEQWPMEDFAVFPPTAAQFMLEGEAPHGGQEPTPWAGVLTQVVPYYVPPFPQAPEGMAPAPDRIPTDEEERELEDAKPAAAGKTAPGGKKGAKGETKPPKADTKPPKGETKPSKPETPPPPPPPKRPAPAESGLGSLDGPMERLTGHPRWDREWLEPDECKAVISSPSPSLIRLASTAGVVLAEIGHQPDTTKKDPGYWLKCQVGGKMVLVACGAREAKTTAKLIGLALRTARLGFEAADKKDAEQALADAREELGLDQT